MAVEGNGHNEYRLHENTTRCRGRFPFTATTRCETSVNLPKVQLASDGAISWCFLQPCLLIV